MSKTKSVYVCRDCGATSPKWLGQCPACSEWNTLEEQVGGAEGETKNRFSGLAPSMPVMRLSEIEDAKVRRMPTGVEELDRVLGGGMVEGSVMIIGAEPGFGKSTLLLQAAEAMSREMKVVFASGEESGGQIAMRARRLGLSGKDIYFLGEINLDKILAAVDREKPRLLIVDSIQTIFTPALSSSPGSVLQVKESTAALVRVAKATGLTVALVGHVTKEGTLAGPQHTAHIVDTVLQGESEPGSPYRLLRSTKNRFAAVGELGVMHLSDKGMRSVQNPSALFVHAHRKPVAGSCIVAAMQGMRPLLVELQALVSPGGGSPRRLAVGLERERLAMLLAVLQRHGGISTSDHDVFTVAVGGVKLEEPATDLPVMLAISSSLRDRPLPRGLCAIGELGLVGELRPVPRGQERLKEAARLGMGMAIIPKANKPKHPIEGLELHPVERIDEALEVVRKLE